MYEDDRTIRTEVPVEDAGPADPSHPDAVMIDASERSSASERSLVDEDTGPLEAVRVVDPPPELRRTSAGGSAMARPGRPLVLMAIGTLLLGLLAWAALRDVAGRLDSSAADATPAPDFDPSFASSFAPGPRLGDLSDVLERARETRDELDVTEDGDTASGTSGRMSTSDGPATSTTGEPSTGGDGTARKTVGGSDGSFGSSQSHNWDSSGNGGGSQSPPRQQPSDDGRSGGGSELCGMPAFC